MILPLKDSVLIQDTDTGDVYEHRDTNHDGVADEKKDGVTTLRNACEKTEFLRSADPFFRPVNLVNAPDGTIMFPAPGAAATPGADPAAKP
jgi:hypothetical protein